MSQVSEEKAGVLAERLLQGVRNIAAQSGDDVEALVEYFYDKGGMAEGLFAIAELRDRKSRDVDMAELIEERDRLYALVNNPQTTMFLEAVRAEAAHQVERWGTVHDRAKEPQDWFWLLGYLGGKALAAHNAGDEFKALHHTISSAAVLANWFVAIKLGKSDMAPGSSDLQQFLDLQFGSTALTRAQGGAK